MTMCQRPLLRVHNAVNGEELRLVDISYAVPRPFDRVTQRTTIEDIFRAVGQAVPWPCEWMRIAIGDRTCDWPRTLALRKRLRTPLMSCIPSVLDVVPAGCSQRETDATHEITAAVTYQIPRDFRASEAQGYCLCDFGGCCTLCNVPSSEVCSGCGNNGCCRCSNCGCDCCCDEAKDFQPHRMCPVAGCRPMWAGPPGMRACHRKSYVTALLTLDA